MRIARRLVSDSGVLARTARKARARGAIATGTTGTVDRETIGATTGTGDEMIAMAGGTTGMTEVRTGGGSPTLVVMTDETTGTVDGTRRTDMSEGGLRLLGVRGGEMTMCGGRSIDLAKRLSSMTGKTSGGGLTEAACLKLVSPTGAVLSSFFVHL